ncbi:hypothetical protein J2Z30_007437 [Streptomyces iranensis]|uniref:Uncharacterized protein n=1 Tax=Streptomyces iranensis TaxID=576784 RepID=A0ABS4N3X7_9ACTN|nr:hypothetical protein [Streptomyces iranensis]
MATSSKTRRVLSTLFIEERGLLPALPRAAGPSAE